MHFGDNQGRIVGIVYKEHGEKFVLLNIYAPNEDDTQFFLESFKFFYQYEGKCIMVGDFNLVRDLELDRLGGQSNNWKACNILEEYTEETMMCDIWRVRNPDKKLFTFMKKMPQKRTIVGSRLDYVFVEMGMESWVAEIKMIPKYKTDHNGIICEILPYKIKRGRGSWKLNNRVLYEIDYVKMINSKIDELLQEVKNKNPQELWEAVKIAIIANSQVYCNE